MECLESSRGSDVDPALLLYETDALVSLEMEEEQDHILSCVKRGKRVEFNSNVIHHLDWVWCEIDEMPDVC